VESVIIISELTGESCNFGQSINVDEQEGDECRKSGKRVA
jgi:hypothetical protein